MTFNVDDGFVECNLIKVRKKVIYNSIIDPNSDSGSLIFLVGALRPRCTVLITKLLRESWDLNIAINIHSKVHILKN